MSLTCGKTTKLKLLFSAALWAHRNYPYNLFFGLATNVSRALRLQTEVFRFDDDRHLQLEVKDFAEKQAMAGLTVRRFS